MTATMLFIVKYLPYAALYLTFRLLERLTSLLGLTPKVQRFYKPSGTANFDGTVQVRRIFWRHKANMAYPTYPWDFISWPSSTSNHTAVLKDNVSLYCVTESEAWFVETPVNVNLYSSDTHPFLYTGQFKLAQKLYVISTETLIALGDFVGQPKVPVVLISNHGRCGSTLLSQIFETVPNVVTLAEPDVLTNMVLLKWQNRVTTGQLHKVVPALMKILCREMNNQKVSLYCVKTRCSCAQLVDIIAEHMPSLKHLFLYRDCTKTVSSMERTFAQGLDVVKFWYQCLGSKIIRALMQKVKTQIMGIFCAFDMTNDRYKTVTDLEFMASLTPLGLWTISWGIPCAEYLRVRKSGVDIKGVRYEDLISATESVVKGLAQHTGIELDPKLIKEKVMPKDSQRGSILSQDQLNSFNKLVPNEVTKLEMQFICNKLGLPNDEGKTVLEGTIAVNL